MKLLDQARDKIRKKDYSIRTEQGYVGWIRQFIIDHDKCHPKDMRPEEVSQYLSRLAFDLQTAASTQTLTLWAMASVHREVLEIGPGDASRKERAKKPERLPEVLNTQEAARVPAAMSGTHQLTAGLLHGCGVD